MPSMILGCVLAGGRSTRFGSDKALAELGWTQEMAFRLAVRAADHAAGARAARPAARRAADVRRNRVRNAELARQLRAHLIDLAGRKVDLVLGATLFRQTLALRMERRPDSSGAYAHHLGQIEMVREFFASATLNVRSTSSPVSGRTARQLATMPSPEAGGGRRLTADAVGASTLAAAVSTM